VSSLSKTRRLASALLLLGTAVPLLASPEISEFLADNVTGIKDEDGSEPDWIEIHNPDASPVNLAGWALTDDPDLEQRWIFPSLTLASGERLVVFASGKDRSNPAANLHTDFSIKASGEYLALLDLSGTPVSEFSPVFPEQLSDISYGSTSAAHTFVDFTSNLSYHIPTANIGDSWRELSFTDPGGLFISSSGGNPLHPGIGYDTYGTNVPILNTIVPTGTTTIYNRLSFSVTDPSALTSLTLEMHYDDAFVAWINGVEVARSSGAPVTPAWNNTSSKNHGTSPDNPEVLDLSSQLGLLQSGTNLLAIQVMNRNSGSGDLVANPRLTATGASTGTAYLSPPTPGTPNSGEFVPGPRIENVTHLPALPGDTDPVTVTATVTPRLGNLSGTSLIYRVMYGSEVTIPMSPAGGDLFTATIPASASWPGQMLRWRVVATDTPSNESREPPFLDNEGTNQSAEYFGTVIADPSIEDSLPVYHWFTQNETNSRNRTGARASFFFNGEFHDNIFVRQRGGATNNGSQKFDFNKGDSFDYDPANPKVGEVNLNARGADSSYLRQPIAFEAVRRAGSPASVAFPVQLRLNDSYDRVGFHIEQVDEDFVKRQDLPKDGALYKFVQRSNLRPGLNDTLVGTEKKTRLTEDYSDLDALIAGLKQSLDGTHIENSGSLIHTAAETAARELFLFDNLNVPEIVDYLAAHVVIQDTDDTRKNFYLYRDSEGSGEWYLFPWDKDFTFGVGESAGGAAKHPFWGDAQHKNPNANQWNVLYDAVHNNPRLRTMILRRTRSLMDQLYTTSASNPAAFFEPESVRLEDLIDPVLNINRSSLVSEFNERRQDLYVNLYGPPGSEPLIPTAQSPSLALLFGSLEFNPPSADQDHEFIELINPNAEDLDISGWTLSGGVDFTFAGGTVVPAGESIHLTPDLASFRSRPTAPTGGEGRFVVGPYSGHLSNFGETLTLSDASAAVVASTSYTGNPSDPQLYLVVSELHYHPAATPAAEFIELLNISDTVTLDLAGVKLSDGPDFDFATASITTLPPGERVLIVRDIAAFESVYGTAKSGKIAGTFANGTLLDNGGERIKLNDATNSTIRDFSYSDLAPWPTAADGTGPSLLLIDPTSAPDHDDPLNWTAGTTGGTPGTREPTAFEAWLAARGQSDPLAEPDGNGWSELQTYILAGDLRPRPGAMTIDQSGGDVTFSFVRRDTPDALVAFELSDNLQSWQDGLVDTDYEILSDLPAGDGTRDVTLRLLPPHDTQTRTFARLRCSVPQP